MPKQLITIIGLIVSLGVIALGVALIAVPMVVSSFSVDAQTASVAATNAVYQSQVDVLTEEAARQDEIDASVAQLQAQIPSTGQLDDVFEVVGNAAASSGVRIVSVTAGQSSPFVARTGVTDDADVAPTEPTPAPTPEPSEGASDGSTGEGTTTDTGTGTTGDEALSGRQQVDFTILVNASDMGRVTAFLDALRSGTRLFSSINAMSATSGDGIEVQVDGLTYVDVEG
ncbi:hypothetical protein SAMN04487846_1595 [Microbacterium sp. cf046]|uniref:hypothetical protein n=1 Tax=Microbacterium sp. cf046 TaxID=1761803 RepID=UPI0008F32897|nr:hypothetical protein [Microbacterium sp. cf046]SFS02657.1 hypothetical protein SAMN04487846_1595 [Microbacterium sp. cf046]